jgi:transmembrane sensor
MELLDRYLAGDATPDEVAAVERWRARTPANALRFEALRAAFGLGTGEPPAYDPQALWARIARDLGRADQAPEPSIGAHATRRPWRRAQIGVMPPSPVGAADAPWRRVPVFAGSAAVIGAIVAAAFLTRGVFDGDDRERAAAPAASREYAAARGQRAELRLSDGTRVVLAPESRLVVPATYDSAERTVVLEGQAYFDVVHDDSKPFAVRAGAAYVRDLGTRFDVRAFPEQRAVRVVVTEGKIRLGRQVSDTGSLLEAGSVGHLSASGVPDVVRGIDTTRFVSWTRGVIVFDRTPVREVIAELARWYDIDVRLADEVLSGRTLTATLRDQSLAEVLRLVGLGLDARVERHDRVVLLRARK